MNITKDSTINFTEVQAPVQQKVGKDYFIDAQGQLDKKSNGDIFEGDFVHRQVAFKDLIPAILGTSASICGSFTHNVELDYVPFTTDARLEYSPAHWVSRTKPFCAEFKGYSTLLIDSDIEQSLTDFTSAMYAKHPKLKDLAHIIVPSSSSGVRRVEDATLCAGGWHIFVIAQFNSKDDRTKAGSDLFKRELIHTGYTQANKAKRPEHSTLMIRSIGVDDSATKDPSRYSFNKPSSIGAGVVKDDLGTVYNEGGVLTRDTFTLSPEEEQQYKIKYAELIAERKAYRNNLKTTAVKDIASRKGITHKQAKKLFHDADKIESKLSLDYTVKTQIGEFTIKQVIEQHQLFNAGVYCNDIIEPEYCNGGNILNKASIKTIVTGNQVRVVYVRFTHGENLTGKRYTVKAYIAQDEPVNNPTATTEPVKAVIVEEVVLPDCDAVDLGNGLSKMAIDDDYEATKPTFRLPKFKTDLSTKIIVKNEVALDKIYEQYIKEDVLLINRCGMGFGKTIGFIKNIKNTDYNTFVNAPLVALCEDFNSKADGFSLYSGTDAKSLDTGAFKLISTLDSAYKFKKPLESASVSFWDEFTMTTQRLVTGQIGISYNGIIKPPVVEFKLMVDTLNLTGCSVIADALISDAQIVNIAQYVNKKIVILESKPIKRNTKTKLWSDPTAIIKQFKIQAVNPAYFIQAYTGSRDEGKVIQEDLERLGVKTCFYHSQLSEQVKRDMLTDIKNQVYKVVLSTSALKTGISFLAPDGMIGVIYNFDNTINCSVADKIQESNRMRNAQELHLLVNYKNEVQVINYETELNRRIKAHGMMETNAIEDEDFLADVRQALIKFDNANSLNEYTAHEQAIIASNNNVTLDGFISLLNSQGFMDVELDDTAFNKADTKELAKDTRAKAKKIMYKTIDEVLDTIVPSEPRSGFNEVQSIRYNTEFRFNRPDITSDHVYELVDSRAKHRYGLMFDYLKPVESSKTLITKIINGSLNRKIGAYEAIAFMRSIVPLKKHIVDGVWNGGYDIVEFDRTKLAVFAKTNNQYLKAFKAAGLKVIKAGDNEPSALQALSVMLSNFNFIVSTNRKTTLITLKNIYNEMLIDRATKNVNHRSMLEAQTAESDRDSKTAVEVVLDDEFDWLEDYILSTVE